MATNTGGSLYFEGGIDTQKLFEDVSKINAQIKSMGDNTAAQGIRMDNSLKNAIGNQKQIITEIEKDIIQMQKKLAQPETFGRIRNDIVLELSSAKKALAEEQAVLVEMQNKSIEANDKEADSQNSLISSIKNWVIGLATVKTALEIGKNMINSTKDGMDGFQFAVAAAENGLSFFWKTLATGDFSNFISNMQKAIEAGYKYAEMMDEVKEATWAMEIEESRNLKRKAELEVQLRDKTLSLEDRKKAGEERIKIEEEEAAKSQAIAKKRYDAAVLIATDRSKLDEKTLIDILKNVDSSTNEKAKLYNEQYRIANYKGGDLTITPEKSLAAKKLLEQAPQEVKLYADALRGYGTLKEEMIINVVDALKQMGRADAQAFEGTKRIRTTISSVESAIQSDAKEAAKKLREEHDKTLKEQNDYSTEISRQRIENQLKIDQAAIDVQKDGAEKSRQQAELNFKKELNDIEKQYAEKLQKYNEINGGIVKGKKTAKYVGDLPLEDVNQKNELILAATIKMDGEITKINKKETDRIKKLWNQVNDSILSGMEKEKAAAKEKYDKMSKDAEGHVDLLQAIENARVEKNREIDVKYALDKIKNEEDLEQKLNRIRVTGFDRQFRLQQANYQTWRNSRMKEWNLLRGSMKPSDQEKAQGILDDINEGDKNQSLSIQEKKLKISQEILQNTGQLIISNAQLLGLNEEQAQALSSALQLGDAAAKAASGDIIGAATEAAGAIMSMLSGIITKSSEFEETMDRINHLIELQNYQWEREKALIDSLVGKESINESAKAIAKNKQDLADLQAIMNKGVTLGGMKGMKDAAAVFAKGDIEKYRDAYEQVLKMQQKGYDFNNKQVDGLKKIIDDYDAIVQRGKDLSIQMEQTLTGTNFSDLTDQMTEMFNSGKDSAVDFADTLESNLKRALTNAFKQQFLMAQLDKLNKDLAIAMGDKDGLTNSEIKSYSEGYKQIFDKAKTEWEKMKESFPDIFSPAVDSVKNASSLSGAIKGASEESINMLSGYANAIRLNQIDSINIMRNQLMYASETAVNTRYLKSIEAGISALVNSDSLRSKGL